MTTSTPAADAPAVENPRPEIVYLSSTDALVLVAPGETKPKVYRRGEALPDQPEDHLLALLESRLIAPIVLKQETADVWAYTGELPAECIQPTSSEPELTMAEEQLDDTWYADMWRHRARVAETMLAARVPFWLARGRLRARRHTWFHRDGSTTPGFALLDNQGRLRGHLTINQAHQLHKHLGRLLSEEPVTPTEGQAS